jgi:hypothetical protein
MGLAVLAIAPAARFRWGGFRWSPLFGLDADRQDSYVIL